MQINPHTFLQSNRRFYLTVTLVFVLLIGVLTFYQWNSLGRVKEMAEGAHENTRYMSCLNALFDLKDYGWDTFMPLVEAVNNSPVSNALPESRRILLEKLVKLPGVRRAYFLENGRQLSSSLEPSPVGMAEVLAGYRQQFGKYVFGCERPTEKIDNMIQNRIRFLNVPFQGDTLRMVVGAFDQNGSPIHILPALRTDPSQARYLIALDLDPRWIRQAVAKQMDEVFHSRWSFMLWSPAPFDSTANYLNGLGVIALGDTIWWRGLKSVTSGLVMPTEDPDEEFWLNFVSLYQEDPADIKIRAEYFRNYYIMLAAVDIAAMVFALLLVGGLVFIRKQWLARQTALTHLAHAIRTPVARLRLDVDTLHEKRSISREEEIEVIESIGNECGRMERAVQNAALSLNGNGHTVERVPGDLSLILSDALRPWETSFRLAGIALESPQKLPTLRGLFDPEMIVTLLDNLLDNALRHTHISLLKNPTRAQKVVVNIKHERGKAVLTVEDSNGGVAVNDRRRIFQRFERGSDSALTGASGLGLGLSLVKEIAEAHGGSVTVGDSDLGGARFVILLPVEQTK